MNLNHLNVFHAVALEGSVSRGAERLSISQPAVSKQIKLLERSMGVPLFDRLPKGVRLTEAGRLLSGYATRLFALETEAERAIADWSNLERGRLFVGASTTIGIYLLPEIFGKFRRHYPNVELRLEIGNTGQIQKLALDNTIDLGLTEGFVKESDLEAEVFLKDELVAIASPQNPLTKQKQVTAKLLAREPFILREPGSGTREVVADALGRKGLTITPLMSLGSTEAIKRAVAAGVGVAIVSKLTIAQELQLGKLVVVPLADLSISRPLHRLHLKGKHESRAVKTFMELLLK